MKPVMVAAILSARMLVINHGKREGLKPGLLRIESEGEWAALLETKRIDHKMTLVSPVWVGERCPTVTIGQELKTTGLADMEVE